MGHSTLAQVAAGTGSCGAEGAERTGVNGSGGNQNGAETNTSGVEKQTAIGRGGQRAAGKQGACMWYARRHKNDATAGGKVGLGYYWCCVVIPLLAEQPTSNALHGALRTNGRLKIMTVKLNATRLNTSPLHPAALASVSSGIVLRQRPLNFINLSA
jgi:hypothetical protein